MSKGCWIAVGLAFAFGPAAAGADGPSAGTSSGTGVVASPAPSAALPPATIDALVGAFNSICAATRADPQAAISKAKEAGYQARTGWPSLFEPGMAPGLKASTEVDIKTDTAKSAVAVGMGPTLLHGRFPTRVCVVVTTHIPNSDLRSAYRALMGYEPDIKEVTHDIYSFAVAGDVRTDISLTKNDEIIRAIDNGSYRAVLAGTSEPGGPKGQLDLLVLMIPIDSQNKAAAATSAAP